MNNEAETFVHAVFPDEAAAAHALKRLLDGGFPSDKISALLRAGDRVEELGVEHKTGVAGGAVLGAVLGAVGGVIASAGGLLLAGPAFVALQGLAAGGALGTLAGSLGGLGVWHEKIDFPEKAFDQGAVLLGVSVAGARVDAVRQALLESGVTEVYVCGKDAAMHSPASLEAHPHLP